MKQVTEYLTIKSEDDSFKTFDEMVNESIKKGFQPFGNPYVCARAEAQEFFVCQAMVRYKE
ncbi:MAG: DUF1737 domain-containing protein [Thermodesulfobacteriota bacterium]